MLNQKELNKVSKFVMTDPLCSLQRYDQIRMQLEANMLAILDDLAVIIHGHSVKGIERVVRCCNENANETLMNLDVKETKHNLVLTRVSYVLCTSFSFWICRTIATRKRRNVQTIARSHSFEDYQSISMVYQSIDMVSIIDSISKYK